jgi:hypothetical protein
MTSEISVANWHLDISESGDQIKSIGMYNFVAGVVL